MDPFVHRHLAPHLPTFEQAPRLWVGLSGGVDSTVLLHSLCQLMAPARISALHIDHGLSPSSGHWRAHCAQLCQALGVHFASEQVQVALNGEGVEQAARHQRYRIFEQYLQTGDVLLLAHHRDDQVETVLYRLLRGSGPKGLAGIPEQRPLGAGQLLRPLLQARRSELESYTQLHGLQWIDDESNASEQFDRNFLRHAVLPVIARHWPDYRERITRSASQHCSAQTVLDEVAGEDLTTLGEQQWRDGWRLDLAAFCALSPQRQANVLRHWIDMHGLPVPGHRMVEAILQDLVPAAGDAQPEVVWNGAAVRRYRAWLYLCREHNIAAQTPLSWSVDVPLPLPDGSLLTAQAAVDGGLRVLPSDLVQVHFRVGGERCKPAQRQHSAPLKKLLQAYGVEPWLRERMPLIYINGELAAVGDLFVCEGFASAKGETGLRLSWQY